ncbi:hypothetical protein CYLTODRAFT_459454 [Cylindrobasidium torrendii FP15055 ss-10]|uniref:Uncharacterized protein n=1 Tax=Cylindrobasidium torrendii FP15055 ss-10 TaxID=1314674 RepID=A0A0D7AU59_9AGAR|nr:hypothetical protein CYLTODRAFT_459454 [Cylindrobasidium torrendii FP15055 ss-10]
MSNGARRPFRPCEDNQPARFETPSVVGRDVSQADAEEQTRVALEAICQRFIDGLDSKEQAYARLRSYFAAVADEWEITRDQDKPFFDPLDAHERRASAAAQDGRNQQRPAHNQQPDDGPEGGSVSPVRPSNGRRRRISPSSDGDEEPELEAPDKKRRPDPSALPWAAAAAVEETALTEAHRRIRACIVTFGMNINFSVRNLTSSFGAPPSPRGQWRNILEDTAVDFEKIHAHVGSPIEFTAARDYQDEAAQAFVDVLGKDGPSLKITTHGHWIICWTRYVDAVVFAYGEFRRAELQQLF